MIYDLTPIWLLHKQQQYIYDGNKELYHGRRDEKMERTSAATLPVFQQQIN